MCAINRSQIYEVGRFIIVGFINLGIDLAIFAVAYYVLDLHLIVANTIAYSLATLNSYLMNKHWTFAGRGHDTISAAEITKFVAFNLGGLAISNVVVASLSRFIEPILAKIASIGLTFVWNYLTIRRFVFNANATRQGSESNEV